MLGIQPAGTFMCVLTYDGTEVLESVEDHTLL